MKLRILEILKEKGKTRYWLYMQLYIMCKRDNVGIIDKGENMIKKLFILLLSLLAISCFAFSCSGDEDSDSSSSASSIVNESSSKQNSSSAEQIVRARYRVEYYLQSLSGNEYVIDNSLTENLFGVVDSTVYAEIKEIKGFSSTQYSVKGTVSRNGTIIKVYYDRNEYNVWLSAENQKGSVSGEGKVLYGNQATVTAMVNQGYKFSGWYNRYNQNELVSTDATYTFTVEKNVSLIGKWTARTDTPYRVEYYFQNIDNFDEYIIDDNLSEELEGETDTYAYADIKEIEGFKATDKSVSRKIVGDGSTVLKVYYNIRKLFYIFNGTLTCYDYAQNFTEIIIPESIDGEEITEIGTNAFKDLTNLEVLTIPDTVKTIGSYAFRNCSNLKKVNFGKGVESIGTGAFLNCTSIKNIDIPNNIKTIESYAFKNCTELQNMLIPSTVTTLGKELFAGCSSLEELTIPFIGENKNVATATNDFVWKLIWRFCFYQGRKNMSIL